MSDRRKQMLFVIIFLLVAGFGPVRTACAAETGQVTAPATRDAAPAAADTTAGRDWTRLDEGEEELVVWDPLEPVNRGIFWFNDKLYFYAIKPVARGYRAVLPEPVRESVGNVFHNLATPVRVVNALLQLKIGRATEELVGFFFNSTFGLAGIFDLGFGVPPDEDGEDFGQTLGHYGVAPGFYLVLPVIGPSNARDAVGRVADSLTHPVPSPYYLEMKPLEVAGLQAGDTVNDLSLDKDTYEAIKRDALDPYLFVRNGYMQSRAARIDR